MILPLPPKVKLQPIQTTRHFGDLTQCKIGATNETQTSLANGLATVTAAAAATQEQIQRPSNTYKTRNSVDRCLPRGAAAHHTFNGNHFDFSKHAAAYYSNCRRQSNSRQEVTAGGRESDFRFTVEGSHTSPAPKERTTLNSFLSDQQQRAQLNQILTTIQDEQKPYESTRKCNRITDSADFDSSEKVGKLVNQVATAGLVNSEDVLVPSKWCQDGSLEDEDDDSDTVQERFSDQDLEGSSSQLNEEWCQEPACQQIRQKLAQKDCIILSLQEQLEALDRKTKAQDSQIKALTTQIAVEEKKQQQKAILFETEGSKLQIAGEQSSFINENNMKDAPGGTADEADVQQSAKTLLRKIKSQIGEDPDKSNIPPVQLQLYDKLQDILEQCLIVDNFNLDVEKSLQSYTSQHQKQAASSAANSKAAADPRNDDFFYNSLAGGAAHHVRSKEEVIGEAVDGQSKETACTPNHKRNETLPRDIALAVQQSEMTLSYAYNTVTFGGKSANVKKFGSLIDGGSSSEATARNMRYHQIEESSQDFSMSRGNGIGLDMSSRSLIKTKSKITDTKTKEDGESSGAGNDQSSEGDDDDDDEEGNEIEKDGDESDSLLFSQLTQQ